MNKHEHNVELNLAETCVDPFILGDFLELMGRKDFLEELKDLQLTYGYIEGSPELRQGIANMYANMTAANILVTGGAIGANFIVFYSLIEPGDSVVCVHPAYQQLYSTAKSLGADVKLLKLSPENKWLPDPQQLAELMDVNKTKMVVINTPHNPSGSLIDENLLRQIIAIVEEHDAILLCDETYRGIYIHDDTDVPSAVDLSESVIVTSSFSKSLSLTGLRLGWIAAQEDVITECLHRRDYTTISNGIIDDALAALAVQNVEKILQRNTELVRRNHAILSEWIEAEPQIEWVSPQGGSVAFLRHHLGMPSEEFCVRLIEEKSTFLVPGTCFDMEGYLRIGYGCNTETLIEGLTRLTAFIDTRR